MITKLNDLEIGETYWMLLKNGKLYPCRFDGLKIVWRDDEIIKLSRIQGFFPMSKEPEKLNSRRSKLT